MYLKGGIATRFFEEHLGKFGTSTCANVNESKKKIKGADLNLCTNTTGNRVIVIEQKYSPTLFPNMLSTFI